MTDQTEDSNPKQKIEAAVNRAGKSFDTLVKEIEKIEGLTTEQIELSFRHLAHLLEMARQRAFFAQQVTGFSLDKPVIFDMSTIRPAVAPIASTRPSLPRTADGLIPGERLSGSGPRRRRPPPIDSFADDAKEAASSDEDAFLDE
jgi:hypothetical protein